MRRCEECGTENDDNATFCSNSECGLFLRWSEESQQPQTLEQPDHQRPSAKPPPPPQPNSHQASGAKPVPPPPPPPGAPPTASQRSQATRPPPPPTPKRPEVEAPPPVSRRPAQYQLVRQRQDPVAVTKVEAPAEAPPAGTAAHDGRQGIYVVVDKRDLSVQPGAETAFSVRVRNTGSIVERAVVEVPDLAAEWVIVDPPGLNIDVGAESAAVVRIRPPLDASSRSGRVAFTVLVWSASNPRVRSSEPMTLAVERFDAVTVAVDPPVASAKKRATFSVSVSNAGNTPISGTLVTPSTLTSANVRFGDRHVSLAAGETCTTEMIVTARRRMLTGVPRTHSVTVGLDGTTAAAPLVQFQQAPMLTKWPARIAVALVLLIGLFGLLAARTLLQSRPRTIPDVVGQPFDSAASEIDSKGFEVQRQDQPDSAPADQVIGQDPEGGKHAKRGSTVTLIVSSGPPDIEVPDFRNQPAAAATELLRQQGFEVVVKDEVPSVEVPAGSIISMDPEPKEVVDSGSRIELIVSTGPADVVVPDVRGLTLFEATARLEQMNLKIILGQTQEGMTRVSDQSPPPGTTVKQGEAVTVQVLSP
jgi:beta-lactam-binding protein with PASTA domain